MGQKVQDVSQHLHSFVLALREEGIINQKIVKPCRYYEMKTSWMHGPFQQTLVQDRMPVCLFPTRTSKLNLAP